MNILHIEASNFIDFPLGGSLSFSKQFNTSISGKIYLVGLGQEGENLGVWFEKIIEGRVYNFFSIGLTSELIKSSLPNRFLVYLMLQRYIKIIYKNLSFCDILFTQTPEFVPLLSKFKWKKSVFCFAGLGNSVSNSKYRYLRFLGGIYENSLFRNLKNHFDVVLAAADVRSIRMKEIEYGMNEGFITSFPTRFDPDIYYPKDFIESRKYIQVDLEINVIISVGRLSHVKGWKSIIEAFRLFLIEHPKSLLFFVGDGDEIVDVEKFAYHEIANGTIRLAGRKSPNEVSMYLSAANVFVMFSYIEGWPTSMVEALACGKVIVSSDISGAEEMITNGINGFIIKNRNVNDFSIAMSKALLLPICNLESLKRSKLYSSSNLNSDFYKVLGYENY